MVPCEPKHLNSRIFSWSKIRPRVVWRILQMPMEVPIFSQAAKEVIESKLSSGLKKNRYIGILKRCYHEISWQCAVNLSYMKLKNTVSSTSFFLRPGNQRIQEVIKYPTILCVCVCFFFRIFIFTLLRTAATRTAKRQDERLAKQKLHVHHACLCISLFAVVARLQARNFIILRFMQVNKGRRFYPSFPELRDSLFEFNSRKIRQRLTN